MALALAVGEDDAIALPDDMRFLRLGEMTASFVLPPSGDGCRLLLPPADAPWLACGGRFLSGPEHGVLLSVERPFDDVAWLGGGEIFISAGGELSRVLPSAAGAMAGVTPVRAVGRFAGERLKLFAAAGRGLYVLARDEVFLVRHEEGSWIRRRVAVGAGVTAVAGDGEVTAVAMGRRVLLVRDGTAGELFAHPDSDVAALAYAPGLGLFYATAQGVGFIGDGLRLEFLRTPGAQIALRSDALFVMLAHGQGVLRIEGLDGLRTLDEAMAAGEGP